MDLQHEVVRSVDVYKWLGQFYIIPFFCVLITLAFLSQKFSKGKFGSLRLPPGPPAWPIVGNIPQLLGTLHHIALADLAKKYGSLMFVRLGAVHAVVISSPGMMKEFLATQDHIFSSRPDSAHGRYLGLDAEDMIWRSCDEVWRHMRKVCAQELMSAKRIAQFELVRREETFGMLERFLEAGKGERIVGSDEYFTQLGLDIMTRQTIGKTVCARKETKEAKVKGEIDYLQLNDELIDLGFFIIGDYIPALAPLDLGGKIARMKKLGRQYSEFFQAIIDEKRRNPTGTHDFLDMLLDTQKNNPDGVVLTDDQISVLCVDLLVAGADTKGTALSWLMAELMRNPQVLKKLQAELDAVVGRDRLVKESDLSQLTYLHAVVKELFRLYPPAPLLVPHQSHAATKVEGYDIPDGTRVIVNVFALGRDPNVWEDALTFNPDRFLKSDIDVKGHHFQLLPFGAGRRMCAGLNLGLLMTEFSAAALLQTCDLALPKGMKPEDVDMEQKAGSTMLRANPVPVVVKPRLPSHVYKDGHFKVL